MLFCGKKRGNIGLILPNMTAYQREMQNYPTTISQEGAFTILDMTTPRGKVKRVPICLNFLTFSNPEKVAIN